MKRRLLFVSLLAVSSADALAGDVENGKEVYLAHGCYSCHGYNGIGRRELINDASGIMQNEELFVRYLRLRADVNPMSPSNSMPNYSEQSLSDEEARDVYAYIKTLSDDPPPADDIPAFNAIRESARTGVSDESHE